MLMKHKSRRLRSPSHDDGSKIINRSQVLPELTISLVEETLKRSRDEEHGAIIHWLLEQFS